MKSRGSKQEPRHIETIVCSVFLPAFLLPLSALFLPLAPLLMLLFLPFPAILFPLFTILLPFFPVLPVIVVMTIPNVIIDDDAWYRFNASRMIGAPSQGDSDDGA